MATQSKSIGLAIGLALGASIGAALGVANDNMGMWLALGIAIGLVFGLAYDQRQSKKHAPLKIVDGATYTIAKRAQAMPGQRSHYWLGDNGAVIELTDEEATQYGLD